MKKEMRTIINILAKEELVSYLVGVPLAVYIVVFCGNFHGEQLQSLIIGVGVAAVLVSPLRFTINLRRMTMLLRALDDPASDIKALTTVKEKLFREPVKHAWSIALAWLFAISIAFLVAHILSGTSIFHIYVMLLVLSVTMPSGFVIAYFITEKGLSSILSKTNLSSIVEYKRKPFSIMRKVLLSLSTLAWYPTAVLSFIIFEIQYKIIVFDYIGFHIAFIMIMITGIMFSIAYLLISSIRLTLKSSGEGLRELSQGNLITHIPEISSDEIGEIASDINILAQSLGKMVKVSINMVDDMNRDSKKLFGFMEEISEGGLGVASSMEEMTSTLEELGASSDAIADNSIKHREFVERVNGFVGNLLNTIEMFEQKALEASKVSKEAMNRVERGSDELIETQRYVHDISTSTRAIRESIDVIKDIADQVNLLSLNASIEAARAGEHGRGFSVVAEEISKLADTTQSNASSITKTINEIIVNVEKELKAMETLTRAFTEIEQFIEETSKFMNGISNDVLMQKDMSGEVKSLFNELLLMSGDNLTAAQEQSKAHQEIINNVSNVSNLLIVFSEKTTGVRDMSKDLSSRAAGLRENIKIFRIE